MYVSQQQHQAVDGQISTLCSLVLPNKAFQQGRCLQAFVHRRQPRIAGPACACMCIPSCNRGCYHAPQSRDEVDHWTHDLSTCIQSSMNGWQRSKDSNKPAMQVLDFSSPKPGLCLPPCPPRSSPLGCGAQLRPRCQPLHLSAHLEGACWTWRSTAGDPLQACTGQQHTSAKRIAVCVVLCYLCCAVYVDHNSMLPGHRVKLECRARWSVHMASSDPHVW